MIDPESIAFDIDGVIADTMTLFIDIARQDFNFDQLKYDDITSYSLEECINMDKDVMDKIIEKLLTGDYNYPLRPIKRAREVILRLADGYGPLLFVTARPYPGPINAWLVKSMGLRASQFELVTTGAFEAKVEILLNRNISCFVEDRLETCFLLKENNISPILFKQPWNRQDHPFVEVSTWKELESLIKFQ